MTACQTKVTRQAFLKAIGSVPISMMFAWKPQSHLRVRKTPYKEITVTGSWNQEDLEIESFWLAASGMSPCWKENVSKNNNNNKRIGVWATVDMPFEFKDLLRSNSPWIQQ